MSAEQIFPRPDFKKEKPPLGEGEIKKPKEKSQAESFFAQLFQEIEKIYDPEHKEQVKNLLEELKRECQDYLEYQQECLKKKQEQAKDGQQLGEIDKEENIRDTRLSKQRLIEDSLEVLRRLFNNYGLETDWRCNFINEEEFKEWIQKLSKEL